MTRPRKRHQLSTRIWHWINAFSVAVLFMSGLNISNAHRRLYWGEWGFEPEQAWAFIPRFPGWATIPGYYSLAIAREWHVLFAWIFSVTLLLFLIVGVLNGHFRRDIVTHGKDWRPGAIWADVRAHLRLQFDHAGAKYNFLQKLAYGLVMFILLPLMIVTGMAMSPGMDAAWSFLSEMFGGRQSARSIHFIIAWTLFGFFVVHVILVLLNKPAKNVGEMITGGTADEAA
ncbi:cytochrome b/b6 domain-containing protein [Croceibacterium sp. LX-88]|uniref:Cytochrome b/b6 domain-containing protein n=1 Tax=Croceibacterium selenioxidans TaxID=2838833 RepID=A0ABS5W1M9_9SPHN|nr:cytochrome b/b6 domain-containing protein [Croceibacterium selenioxidans]MBT2133381.1 cytochrome b/b6 domain-containing protein [Croceibacterium selenioxidans]